MLPTYTGPQGCPEWTAFAFSSALRIGFALEDEEREVVLWDHLSSGVDLPTEKSLISF